MKKLMIAVALPLVLTMLLCACGDGTTSASGADSPAVPETPEETKAATENTTDETEKIQVDLPEDACVIIPLRRQTLAAKGLTPV